MQQSIPCTLMRGGTSKGPFFLASDLPSDPVLRDRMLLAIMGSPDQRQIDGIGGGTTLTSKVAIVGPSTIPDADVDYLFAQVSVDRAVVDVSPNCGNMLAGVGAFAIERGLIEGWDPRTTLIIHNVNTGALVEQTIETPGGQPTFAGNQTIDGVPGSAAPVRIRFLDAAGKTTGALLPTGRALDVIDGVGVSCVDMAIPVVLIPATAFGLTGREMPIDIEYNDELMARIEHIRREAGRMMGLGEVGGRVIPKVAVVAPGSESGAISSRYFTPQTVHTSHAVTGAICVAAACGIEGSCANLINPVAVGLAVVRIEHPAGCIQIELETTQGPDGARVIKQAAVLRTTRKLFDGNVWIPETIMANELPAKGAEPEWA